MAVERHLDRAGKASEAATAEEHEKRVSDNTGDQGNRTAEGSGLEDRKLCHPQRRKERKSETGDKGKK